MEDFYIILLVTGWLCFILFLWLPAVSMSGMILSGNVRGFLLILFSFIKFLDVWRSLKLKGWKGVERKDVYFALLSLSNALMIISPLLLLKYSDLAVIKILFIVAGLLVCSTLLLPDRKDVRAGYYFWVLSFAVVAVAAIIS